jgi:hypothetical protein
MSQKLTFVQILKMQNTLGSNWNQANITQNTSIDFVLQPAVEESCKQPTLLSELTNNNVTL